MWIRSGQSSVVRCTAWIFEYSSFVVVSRLLFHAMSSDDDLSQEIFGHDIAMRATQPEALCELCDAPVPKNEAAQYTMHGFKTLHGMCWRAFKSFSNLSKKCETIKQQFAVTRRDDTPKFKSIGMSLIAERGDRSAAQIEGIVQFVTKTVATSTVNRKEGVMSFDKRQLRAWHCQWGHKPHQAKAFWKSQKAHFIVYRKVHPQTKKLLFVVRKPVEIDGELEIGTKSYFVTGMERCSSRSARKRMLSSAVLEPGRSEFDDFGGGVLLCPAAEVEAEECFFFVFFMFLYSVMMYIFIFVGQFMSYALLCVIVVSLVLVE